MAKKQVEQVVESVTITEQAVKIIIMSALRYYKFKHNNAIPGKIIMPLPKSFEGVPVEYIEMEEKNESITS